MLKNKKGFTVVELIVSFAFVSLLAIQLFQAVLNYRDKQDEAHIETQLIEFKNKMTLLVQKDIETKLLKSIDYCRDGSGTIINRCARISFMDSTYKDFRIETQTTNECVCYSNKPLSECADKDKQCFDVTRPYIVYGDIEYDIPDGYNVDFDTQYLLQYTTIADDLENKHGLYKLSIGLKHRTIDFDLDINIVTTGLAKVEGTTNTYAAFSRGDVVKVEVSQNDQLEFFVLEDSGSHNSTILLLAKADVTRMAFNAVALGNQYEGSAIETYLTTTLYNRWQSLRGPQYISLPTFEQVASLNNFCPERKYRSIENYRLNGSGSDPIKRSKINEFWYGDYWTMESYYDLTDKSSAAYVPRAWYVYGNKALNGDGTVNEAASERWIKASNVSLQHGVRPVIEIEKKYIMQRIS